MRGHYAMCVFEGCMGKKVVLPAKNQGVEVRISFISLILLGG